MRNLLNPKWLFVINTLPIVLLYFQIVGEYNIIKTLLDEDSIHLWKNFSFSLGIMFLLNFAYTVYLTLMKRNVSAWYGIIALLCYITFIYLYGYNIETIFPNSLPDWMVSENIYLYVGTFLMPTLAYSLFILVSHFTAENKEYKAWESFLIAIGIPITGYLFTQITLPLWKTIDREFGIHAILILIIVITLVFLFFLIRAVYILTSKKSEAWQKYKLVWKILIAIVLPLVGLYLNNGGFSLVGSNGSEIFGDFNNPWFYILAAVNGILICLPNLKNKPYRLLLFLGRSVTFTYTFYFFMVFLPFLPVSIIAVIAIGTGFLMLTPLALFHIHINELSKDFIYLKTFFSKKLVFGLAVLSFLVIPSCITSTYLNDKNVLNETLSYVYSPDYSKNYDIDKDHLQKTITNINNQKDNRRRRRKLGMETPYLSSFYYWLVLDNLTLSDSKIKTIEKIFYGKPSYNFQAENVRGNDKVIITNISTNSRYDKTQNAWKSWVDLEITNTNDGRWLGEYATMINLPEGCWISDYYLYVGDKKEPGILAEKKSAMWVFTQIQNENRDPGILYYLTGKKVAFKVFPFAGDEVRKTGIEFLHKEPITLTIDNNIIELGNQEETIFEKIETENIIYISAKQKQALPSIKRTPYFHFLVDVSINGVDHRNDFVKRIEKALENNKPLSENAKISFVNSYVNSTLIQDDWKEIYKNQTAEGGFYLDRAIRKTLINSYQNKSNTYPVIVVVTDRIRNAVLNKKFNDLEFTFPESELFFNIDENGKLREHSLIKNPTTEQFEIERDCMFCEDVLEFKLSDNSIAYLPNNNEPSIILKNDIFKVSETEIKEKNWKSSLVMQGQWVSQILHPETSDKEWLNLIKYSFISKVMTPLTSYLVVENEAQKAILKKKQEQVLSGNKALDIDGEAQRMSEPSLILLIICFGLILWIREKRKQQFIK